MNGYWPSGYDDELDSILTALTEIRKMSSHDLERDARIDILRKRYSRWHEKACRNFDESVHAQEFRQKWASCSSLLDAAIDDYTKSKAPGVDPDFGRLEFIRSILHQGQRQGYDGAMSVEIWGHFGVRFTRYGTPQLIVNDFWHTPWDYGLLCMAPGEFTGREEEYAKAIASFDETTGSKLACTTFLELFEKPQRIHGVDENLEEIGRHLEILTK